MRTFFLFEFINIIEMWLKFRNKFLLYFTCYVLKEKYYKPTSSIFKHSFHKLPPSNPYYQTDPTHTNRNWSDM